MTMGGRPPAKFEAGTMQTAEVVAVTKSIKFIQDLGIKKSIET